MVDSWKRFDSDFSQAICSWGFRVLRNVKSAETETQTERETVVCQPGQGRNRAATLSQDHYLRFPLKRDRF
ncbi:hypothetical protein TNCV_2001691 [Trichonephila clavipes]|nr:hypothetical protein TNCV_2001691 [Trichonephila clavipes]